MKKRISRIIGVGVTLALLTSLFVMAIPASALSQPSVSITSGWNDISKEVYGAGTYTIQFVTGKALSGATDYIEIQFPVGTTVGYPYAGNVTATIDASPVWVSGNWTYAVFSSSTWTTGNPLGASPRTLRLALGAGDQVGLGSTVTITVQSAAAGKGGLINPSTPADYTLTVKTSDETTPVTSTTYTIKTPTLITPPGQVRLYNPAGHEMISPTTSINTALASAGEDFRLEIGPGFYDENITTNYEGLTFVATGTAEETIIEGSWTIGDDEVTIDGLTLAIEGAPGINITGDDVTIQNCNLTKKGRSTSYYLDVVAQDPMILYDNADAVSPTGTISNCTIDSSVKYYYTIGVIDTALEIDKNGLTVSGCTFTVDADTTAANHDTAVDLGAATDWTFTYYTVFYGNTVTGSSGIGMDVTNGALFASYSTFSDLYQALVVNGSGAYVSLDTSTVSNCGKATTTLDTVGMAAMVVDAAYKVMVKNSTVTGNPNDIIEVNDDADKVYVMFNDLSDNTKGVDNDDADTSKYVTATHNWWGDPLGPSTTFNTGKVYYTPFLGGTATGSFDTAKTELLKRTTVGVDVAVTIGTGTMDIVGVANYAENPQDATEDPALAGGFYDVLVSGVTGTVSEITLKFYNANISEDTSVLVWSKLMGAWTPCAPATATAADTQGVNLFGGYAWVKVSSTSTPSIGDLAGTEFALVEPPPEPELDVTVIMPTFGDSDVSIKPTFTWSAADDATGYEFVIAEELGLDDPFEIIDYSATSTTNGHVAREDLKYSTTYWWRVRASSATDTGVWAVSFFTTEDEPEEAAPPIVVEEKEVPAPVITVEIPPAVEKVTSAIPDWALYTIIAVGAVLIIAVIVLIVRTRRVA